MLPAKKKAKLTNNPKVLLRESLCPTAESAAILRPNGFFYPGSVSDMEVRIIYFKVVARPELILYDHIDS